MTHLKLFPRSGSSALRQGDKIIVEKDLIMFRLGTVDGVFDVPAGAVLDVLQVDVTGWNARIAFEFPDGGSSNRFDLKLGYIDIKLPERNVEPTREMLESQIER